jgi:hypothetical protein
LNINYLISRQALAQSIFYLFYPKRESSPPNVEKGNYHLKNQGVLQTILKDILRNVRFFKF